MYLALPITSSLTDGHCLIIPTQHTSAATFLDENVMEEVIVRFFLRVFGSDYQYLLRNGAVILPEVAKERNVFEVL